MAAHPLVGEIFPTSKPSGSSRSGATLSLTGVWGEVLNENLTAGYSRSLAYSNKLEIGQLLTAKHRAKS